MSLIEEVAANALPPAVLQLVDGWRLRYNFGVTRRANSVLAAARSGRTTLEPLLELAEAFYARWNAPARFQLSPASRPEGLDALLESRGYHLDAAVQVQTAAIDVVAAQARVRPEHAAALHARLSEDWLELFLSLDGADERQADVRRGMFKRIPTETAYVLVRLEGRPAAVGLGVLERGYLGVFNMGTHPDFRRRGAAAAILRSLADWGAARGGRAMYLQVAEENAAARSLYERLGFRALYRYHYRVAPTP